MDEEKEGEREEKHHRTCDWWRGCNLRIKCRRGDSVHGNAEGAVRQVACHATTKRINSEGRGPERSTNS